MKLSLKKKYDKIMSVITKFLLRFLYAIVDKLESGRELRGDDRVRYRPPDNNSEDRYPWHFR